MAMATAVDFLLVMMPVWRPWWWRCGSSSWRPSIIACLVLTMVTIVLDCDHDTGRRRDEKRFVSPHAMIGCQQVASTGPTSTDWNGAYYYLDTFTKVPGQDQAPAITLARGTIDEVRASRGRGEGGSAGR